MIRHSANRLQSQKFRITKYWHRLYSLKDESERTLKIEVLKNKMFGNKTEKKALKCSLI